MFKFTVLIQIIITDELSNEINKLLNKITFKWNNVTNISLQISACSHSSADNSSSLFGCVSLINHMMLIFTNIWIISIIQKKLPKNQWIEINELKVHPSTNQEKKPTNYNNFIWICSKNILSSVLSLNLRAQLGNFLLCFNLNFGYFFPKKKNNKTKKQYQKENNMLKSTRMYVYTPKRTQFKI